MHYNLLTICCDVSMFVSEVLFYDHKAFKGNNQASTLFLYQHVKVQLVTSSTHSALL